MVDPDSQDSVADAMDVHSATDADADADCGDSMDTIYRGLSPWEQRHFPAIEPSAAHTVLFNLPLPVDPAQPPRPFRQPPKWDALHVRLPCSSRNQYPVVDPDGTESIKNRWELICATLEAPIRTSAQLEAAILAYNTKYARTWKFRALHQLCAELPADASDFFFTVTLPGIIRLALQLPDMLQAPVPLLKAGRTASVSFTQQQCASLLANAFLCTFPRRNTQRRGSEYRTFPDINFNRLFHTPDAAVLEKLKCLLHYFSRVATGTPPTGCVTVVRRCTAPAAADASAGAGQTPAPVRWEECGATFAAQRLHVASAGTIEDQGCGLLQVDFANKYLGGGVLGRGCVQEEIRFVCCPELMVTKLIAEVLQPNEALFVVGCERFSQYTGYAGTFTFAGEFTDDTPLDEWRRRCCTIVAIDALNFQRTEDQFREEAMRRELDKAWAGWAPWLRTPAPAVATGNWGCGAFGGDKRLKALLQMMVCTVVGRPLVYYTFGDAELRAELLEVWRWLRTEAVTIAQLWTYLKGFRAQQLPARQLYPYIYQAHRDTLTPVTTTNSTSTPQPPAQSTKSPPAKSPPNANRSSPTATATATPHQSALFSWPSAQKKKRIPDDRLDRLLAAASEDADDADGNQPPAVSSTEASPLPKQHQPNRPTSSSAPSTAALGSLLASLDEDYTRRRPAQAAVTVTTTPATIIDVEPEADGDEQTVEERESEAGANSPEVISVLSTPESLPSSEQAASSCEADAQDPDDVAVADAAADSEESDAIPATPTPPEVKKRAQHHKRQSSIFDYMQPNNSK